MILNPIRTASIAEAKKEISIRKKKYPQLIHTAKYNNGSLIIKSSTINNYISEKKTQLFQHKTRAF